MKEKKISPIEILLYIAIFLGGLYFALHLGYAIHVSVPPGEQMEFAKVFEILASTIEANPMVFVKDFSFNNMIGTVTIYYIVISMFIVAWFTIDQKKYLKGKEHGSAAWASKRDSEKLMDKKNKENNIILTADTQLCLNTRKTRKNLNILVVGGSGAGKTRFFVKPNVMQANTSYVITDPKGELLRSTGKLLESEGYKVKAFNLINMNHSTNYNPFEYIRTDNDIMKLINNIIKNTNGGQKSNDPFWEKAETALLMAIISYLWYEGEKEEQNFGMVMELLRQAEVKEEDEAYESPLDILFKELKEADSEHLAVKYYTVFKQASGRTAKSILISCSVRLAIFNLDEVKKLMSGDDINIPGIAEEKTALFIIIPDSDDTFNCLVALLYSQIFDTLYNLADFKYGGRLPHHVRCIIDEFANIGTIPNFDKLIATMRSREISVNPIVQNLAQLKTMYKDSWESIIGNCDSFLFLGGMERASLDYISKGLGKMTIDTLNRSVSRGKSNSTSRNEGILGRELMTSSEVGEMPDSDCILFVRGVKPFYNKKFSIEKHERYKMLEESNDKNTFHVTSLKTHDYSNGGEIEEDDSSKVMYYVEELQINEGDQYLPGYEEIAEKELQQEAQQEDAIKVDPIKETLDADNNIAAEQIISEIARTTIDKIAITEEEDTEVGIENEIGEEADTIISNIIATLIEEANIEETDIYLPEYENEEESENNKE